MQVEPRARPARVATMLLVGLFSVALSLRPQIVAIGPLIPGIRTDLGVSFLWAGLLTTLPVLCMGLFAPLSPLAVRRFGAGHGVTAAVSIIAVGGLVRAAAPTPALLLGFTVVTGIGIALGGSLLPVVVKQRFPHRPMTATGAYVAGIQLGATVAAAAAVPVANATSGWRAALAVISGATLLVLVPWLWRGGGAGDSREGAARIDARPWHIPRAGSLVALFAVQSIPFYGLVTWLPAHLVEEGWSEAAAGTALSVLTFTGLFTSLSVTRLADRLGSRRAYLWGGNAAVAAAVAGLIIAPALGYLWAILAGGGLSVLFAVVLTLPLDVTTSGSGAAGMTALVLGVGYTLASVAPSLLGALRDLSGNFTWSLLVLLVSLTIGAAIAATLGPDRLQQAASADLA